MSPAATLDETEAEDASLRAADALFYSQGITAVTMAEIRDTSGVSLRRLYTMYPSKSDLVAAWLNYRHDTWMHGLEAQVSARLVDGEEPVTAIFGAVEAWMVATSFRGCGFINTYAEQSELTDEHRQIIRMHKHALADYLSTLTPSGAAIAVLVDGAIVQAAIFANTDPIHIAREAAATIAGSN